MIDFAILIQGMVISIGLIMAIGPQNAFVLRQGIRRQHVFTVVSACFLSDAFLISMGVAGMGALFALNPYLKFAMTGVGITFITIYGGLAFRAALRPTALDPEASGAPKGSGQSAKAAMLTVLAFTWLNPHTYVDTLVLIGGISSQYDSDPDRLSFAIGAVAGSAMWFLTLGYGAGRLAPIFESQRAWRILDAIIGTVMWTIAIMLTLSLLSEMGV